MFNLNIGIVKKNKLKGKVKLIFDHELDGHHLEYIHHLYMGALKDLDNIYYFLLPPDFKKLKKKFLWPHSKNVTFLYISSKDDDKIKNSFTIFKSINIYQIIQKVVISKNIESIFFISLMVCMPFFPMLISKKVKVSGIIYLIYIYRWSKSSWILKVLDSIKYFIFTKSKVFDKIFLLNDEISPVYLNKKFKTKVFYYLPDPFISGELITNKTYQPVINISKKCLVYLHFGALSERKGTLEIIKAIDLLNSEVQQESCFIFAGKINEDIRDSFYKIYETVKLKTEIIIYEKFIDYQLIGELCKLSDYILIPYKNVEQSSGVISYAAFFETGVICPRDGLLGKLVKRYKLGYFLNVNNYIGIAEFINKNNNSPKLKINRNYIEERTIYNFQKIILNL